MSRRGGRDGTIRVDGFQEEPTIETPRKRKYFGPIVIGEYSPIFAFLAHEENVPVSSAVDCSVRNTTLSSRLFLLPLTESYRENRFERSRNTLFKIYEEEAKAGRSILSSSTDTGFIRFL